MKANKHKRRNHKNNHYIDGRTNEKRFNLRMTYRLFDDVQRKAANHDLSTTEYINRVLADGK